ncbi:MAG: hypothetical protein M5U28_27035 [Sandaracinaceae bacterium]|nr:hypothetical protein [Sandaracinaceae bacterium]
MKRCVRVGQAERGSASRWPRSWALPAGIARAPSRSPTRRRPAARRRRILDRRRRLHAARPPGRRPAAPPADRRSSSPTSGDPAQELLEVEGEVGTLDVFFSIDTTGSFGGEIDNLQSELPPHRGRSSARAWPTSRSGVGRFEDFPELPSATEPIDPSASATAITTDDARVGSAVAALDQPLGNGGDIPSRARGVSPDRHGRGLRRARPRVVGRSRAGRRHARRRGLPRRRAARRGARDRRARRTSPPTTARRSAGTRSTDDAIEALSALGVRTLGVESGSAHAATSRRSPPAPAR